MKFWDYNKPTEYSRIKWNNTLIELINSICEMDSSINEFNILIPEKFKNFIQDFISVCDIKFNKLYNVKFINVDIDYIIIEDVEVIKINNFVWKPNLFILNRINNTDSVIEEITLSSLEEYESIKKFISDRGIPDSLDIMLWVIYRELVISDDLYYGLKNIINNIHEDAYYDWEYMERAKYYNLNSKIDNVLDDYDGSADDMRRRQHNKYKN